MRFEKRTNSDGSEYYSFIMWDAKAGKQRRLTREEIRTRFGKDILTEAEANDCVKLLEAKFESEKVRILRRVNWEKEFYSFAKLLDQYTEDQKKSAPNSWQNSTHYLKHYVLVYFLQIERLNNIELWRDNFEGFRTYLETATTIRGGKPIAYNSKNHAIKALNTFLSHLEKRGAIEKAYKCDTFPEHLLNRRTIDDVVHPEEMERVYKALHELGHETEARLYRYLFFSGMRFNEALAISLGDLYQGVIENELLAKKLTAYKMKYVGYVVSDGQFGGVTPDGRVLRLPFKGTKKIEERFNRVIPVLDKVLWNELVGEAERAFKAQGSATDSRDCLLFSDIDDTMASRRLEEAYKLAKLRYRTWHCLRHSRATWLIGETGDTMLARVWLGHNSPKTIEKYNHMYQAIARAAKAGKLTGKKFGLKKV